MPLIWRRRFQVLNSKLLRPLCKHAETTLILLRKKIVLITLTVWNYDVIIRGYVNITIRPISVWCGSYVHVFLKKVKQPFYKTYICNICLNLYKAIVISSIVNVCVCNYIAILTCLHTCFSSKTVSNVFIIKLLSFVFMSVKLLPENKCLLHLPCIL